jgi:hypothetical protein
MAGAQPKYQIYGVATAEEFKRGLLKVGFVNPSRNTVEERLNQLQGQGLAVYRSYIEPRPTQFSDGVVHAYLSAHGFHRQVKEGGRSSEYFLISPKQLNAALDVLQGKPIKRSVYKLRAAQKLALERLIASYDFGHDTGLLAAIPRFGKTLVTMELTQWLMDRTGKNTVLFISGKLDTRTSIIHHSETYDFGFDVHVMNNEWHKAQHEGQLEEGRWLIYSSIQDIGDMLDGKLKDKFDFLDRNDIAGVIFDEAHYAAMTTRTKRFIESMDPAYTLYVTGTPFGLVEEGIFTRGADNTFFYDLIDENRDVADGILTRLEAPELVYYIAQHDLLGDMDARSWREVFDDDVARDNLEKVVMTWFPDPRDKHSRSPLHQDGEQIKNAIIVCPSEVKYCRMMWDMLNEAKGRGLNVNAIMASGENRNVEGDDTADWYEEYNELCRTHPDAFNFLITLGKGLQAVDYPDLQAVIVLSDGESAEQFIQACFRSKTGNGKKTKGYVIDYKRTRCLQMIHKQADAHIDNDGSIKVSREKYEDLYREFTVLENVDGDIVKVDLFYENIISTFTKGDYSDRISNLIGEIDADVLRDIERFLSPDVDAPRRGKKMSGTVKVTGSKGGGSKGGGSRSREDGGKAATTVEMMIANIATFIFYLPALIHVMAEEPKTIEDVVEFLKAHKDLSKTMTTVDPKLLQFLLKKDVIGPKSWTKILVEAIAKSVDPEVPLVGDSRPVPKGLAEEMRSRLTGDLDRVLVVCGGRNLIPDEARSVHVIEDSPAQCEIMLADGVDVEYCEPVNLTKRLEEMKMDFTHVIMNPPYGNLHLKILKRVVERMPDAQVVSLQPVRAIQQNWRRDADLSFLDDTHIEVALNAGDNSTFGAYLNFDVGIITRGIEQSNVEEFKRTARGRDASWVIDLCKRYRGSIPKMETYDGSQKNGVPIAMIIGGNGHTDEDDYRNIARDGYGYLRDGICSVTGETLEDSKKPGNGDVHNWPVVVFDTAEEAKNFFGYLHLKPFRYICGMVNLDVNVQVQFLPFPSDFTKPWTDARFKRYFGVSDDEWKTMLEVMG